jgi:hypothetical protein
MFSDSILTFALIVLSTAAGIVGLYLLPIAGIALLIVAGVGLLRVVLSYVRSPVGQHKDAGEGALTVATLSARKDKTSHRNGFAAPVHAVCGQHASVAQVWK